MSQAMNRRWSGRAAACVGLLATAAAVHGQNLELHVDDDAPPGGDGLSWSSAFRSLAEALQLAQGWQAQHGAGVHLKVAQGTYVPGHPDSDRHSTFLLLSGLTLRGGFAGINAANPDENDPGRFVTVLSGDRFGDDQPGFLNRADNVLHVVTIGDTVLEPALTGFTIRGGHADGEGDRGRGAGIRAAHPHASCAVVNCVIADNYAVMGGGFATSPVASGLTAFIGSSFVANRAEMSGGAAWCAQAYFENCRMVSNEAEQGGGVYSHGRAILAGCAVWGNTAARGAGVFAERGLVELTACTMANAAMQYGNDLLLAGGAAAVVRGTILAGRSPHVHVGDSCVLESWFNLAAESLVPTLTSATSAFVDVGSVVGSPRFADPLGLDGVAGTPDDDLRPLPNSPAIDAGVFVAPWFADQLNLDAAGALRVVDDPGMPNIGEGAGGAMDIGAYEFQGVSCRADHDGDGQVGPSDIFAYLVDWFAQRAEADFDRDRQNGVADIFGFLTAWFAGCP
jgi:hypothetical protein